MTIPIFALIVLIAASVDADAQTAVRPVVVNGQVSDRAVASGGLAQTVAAVAAATDVAWVGYAVPMAAGDHHLCCWNDDSAGCCATCALEPGTPVGVPAVPSAGADPAPVRLEPASTLVVMVRVVAGRVERVRTFSDGCRLDAGGRVVHWLTAVAPAESVRWLSGLVTTTSDRRVVDGVLGAAALHAESAALDWLVETARASASARVRGQALFWLAQRAGQRALGAITEAVDRDPDTDVKKRAVFALSQLPPDDGVPRLITIARGHSNQTVRKQAFFWLGQSKDPRALSFFLEVLGR